VIDVATRYVLIDFENVQPDTLERLDPKLYAVFVFVGANQAKMPTNLVMAMQRFVRGFRCIQISGNGPNALDFHIAYYLGRIAAAEPDASFYIISKDSGFDPVIRHLQDERITVRRILSVDEIASKKSVNAKPLGPPPAKPSDKLAEIIDDLKRRGSSRPRTLKALCATINARFSKKLTEQELSGIVDQLRRRGTVSVEGTKVSYQLPA
jgi:hypothetical protein